MISYIPSMVGSGNVFTGRIWIRNQLKNSYTSFFCINMFTLWTKVGLCGRRRYRRTRPDQTCTTNSQTTLLGSPARTRVKSVNWLKVPMRFFIIYKSLNSSVADPDPNPDPRVFGPPGSGSGSCSGSGSGSFYHHAKIVRKHWFLLFCGSFWLFIFEKWWKSNFKKS